MTSISNHWTIPYQILFWMCVMAMLTCCITLVTTSSWCHNNSTFHSQSWSMLHRFFWTLTVPCVRDEVNGLIDTSKGANINWLPPNHSSSPNSSWILPWPCLSDGINQHCSDGKNAIKPQTLKPWTGFWSVTRLMMSKQALMCLTASIFLPLFRPWYIKELASLSVMGHNAWGKKLIRFRITFTKTLRKRFLFHLWAVWGK